MQVRRRRALFNLFDKTPPSPSVHQCGGDEEKPHTQPEGKRDHVGGSAGGLGFDAFLRAPNTSTPSDTGTTAALAGQGQILALLPLRCGPRRLVAFVHDDHGTPRSESKQGVCTFCGERGSRSREDVVPMWLAEELGSERPFLSGPLGERPNRNTGTTQDHALAVSFVFRHLFTVTLLPMAGAEGGPLEQSWPLAGGPFSRVWPLGDAAPWPPDAVIDFRDFFGLAAMEGHFG